MVVITEVSSIIELYCLSKARIPILLNHVRMIRRRNNAPKILPIIKVLSVGSSAHQQGPGSVAMIVLKTPIAATLSHYKLLLVSLDHLGTAIL